MIFSKPENTNSCLPNQRLPVRVYNFYLYTMFTVLNPEELRRKKTFDFYKDFEDPFFNLTANVDVTQLLNLCKKEGHSFFLLSLHAALAAANGIPEFRFRLVGEELRVYDVIHPGSTILKSDNTFTFCYFDFDEDWRRFEEKGAQKIAATLAGNIFDPAEQRHDLVYCSSIPWISFTQFKHARKGNTKNSIPKMAFGKYFQRDNRWWLPFSTEVHHSLLDGFHIGKFYTDFQNLLDEF